MEQLKLYQANAFQLLKEKVEKLAQEDEQYKVFLELIYATSNEAYHNTKVSGRDVANTVVDFVNRMGFDTEEFADEITNRTHRTLQQNVFKLFRDTIYQWAEYNEENRYDMRNEATVKQSAKIKEAIDGEGLPLF